MRAVVLALPSPHEPKKPLERVLSTGVLGHVARSKDDVDAVLLGFAGLRTRSRYRLSVGRRRAESDPALRASLGVALLHEPRDAFDDTVQAHVDRARALRRRHGLPFDAAFGDAWIRTLPAKTSELSTPELRYACALGLALELEAPTALLLAAPTLEPGRRDLFVDRLSFLAERVPTLLVATDDRDLESFTSGRLLHQGTPPVIYVHALVTRAAEVVKILAESGETATAYGTGSEFSRVVVPCKHEVETTKRLLAAIAKSDGRLRSLRAERYLPETLR